MRIVGSMTTLPNRIKDIILPIKSILNQSRPLDLLYLNIPYITTKRKKYKIPTTFMDNFNNYSTKIVLNRCIDKGPITKLSPILDIEKGLNTYIITFDDDVIVNNQLVKIYERKIKKEPEKCFCFTGICIGNFPFYFQIVFDNDIDFNVDWIQGCQTVIYKRSFFTTSKDLETFGDDTNLKKELFLNDDHRISAYLETKDIPRISIGKNAKDFITFYRNASSQTDALSGRTFDLSKEHFKIITHFMRKNIYNKSYTYTNSMFFLAYVFIFLFILFIAFKSIIIFIFTIILYKILCIKYKFKLYSNL